MVYESIMLSILVIEHAMETIHLYFDSGREWKEKYLHNNKFVFKALFLTIFVVDYSYFYSYYRVDALRVGRYFRPRNAFMINA